MPHHICYKIRQKNTFPASIYLLKVNNRNTRTRWDICSKLAIKIPGQYQWHRFGVFTVNFEWISHLDLVFFLKKNFMALFYEWGSTASRLEPLRGSSLLFTTKFPEIPGTHFIDLRRIKGWVELGATSVVLNIMPLD